MPSALAFPAPVLSVLRRRAARILRRALERLDPNTKPSPRRSPDAQVSETRKIAHDLMNVLTAVSGYAQLLQSDLRSPSSSQSERVEEILFACSRASSLVRQLLTFDGKESPVFERLDLNRVIEDYLSMLRLVLGSRIDVKVEAAPRLAGVRASREHMERILMNVAMNARDAMNGKGTLLIETANIDVREHGLEQADGPPPGPYVGMKITDYGCGMDSSTKSRIFQPFFTTKPEGQGTGIGLTTVYSIVKKTGGHISVDSELGRGTAFTIFFPTAG